MKKIRVLVVDDSAVVRQVLMSVIDAEPDMEVMAAAADPIFAMEKLAKEWPDVIVLDVEMPRMNGIAFLKKIMTEHPLPVIICSSLTEKGANITLQALAAGAVDIITKPKLGLKQFLQESASEIAVCIREAARIKAKHLASRANQPRINNTILATISAASEHLAAAQLTGRIIAIGTSTGGTQALEVVLTALPRNCPGLIIVQHMPEKFTAQFAERLNKLCQIEVREAKNFDRVAPGLALIAPGGKHMQLKRNEASYYVEIIDGPFINRHRPSVDVLFRSVAKTAGKNAIGIIMTGMGSDGAHGLKDMQDAGCFTIAQDEETCVVFGMPKEAIKLQAVKKIVALQDIAAVICGRTPT